MMIICLGAPTTIHESSAQLGAARGGLDASKNIRERLALFR